VSRIGRLAQSRNLQVADVAPTAEVYAKHLTRIGDTPWNQRDISVLGTLGDGTSVALL